MKIKALQAFTLEDLTSVACGAVVEVTDTLGASLIEDGLAEEYTLITPTGTKSITENGENIDVAEYAKANVNVPQPTGKIEITANGTDIDVSQYATADVSVPNPSTGSISLTENGSHDVTQYAIADVLVEISQRNYTLTVSQEPDLQYEVYGIPYLTYDGLLNEYQVHTFDPTMIDTPISCVAPVFNNECKIRYIFDDLTVRLALANDATGCTLVKNDDNNYTLTITTENANVHLYTEYEV